MPREHSWFDQFWNLPILRFFVPGVPADPTPSLVAFAPPAPILPACSVEPLPAIEDIEAHAFEAQVGSVGVVRTDGMTPAAVQALSRFEYIIKSVGGSITLTSAYRPAAYQEHLQAVWDKWMLELRKNDDAECRMLRAEVEAEFARHDLLESQRPATTSDHTRGISFDAAILLPSRARWNKRRVTVDRLARAAGFHRPVIASDPVHFRLIAGV
jgi:hypothetical protein